MILAIAGGGALGAVGRYLAFGAVTRVLGTGFPWGTLLVNILGSLALGLLIGWMANGWTPRPELKAFFVTGVLGAFTTFSMFSFDLFGLLERGQAVHAFGYALGSVALCLLGFWLGYVLIRQGGV